MNFRQEIEGKYCYESDKNKSIGVGISLIQDFSGIFIYSSLIVSSPVY